MVTSDWISLGVAIGTISLAVVAGIAILQTRRIRAEDRESDFKRSRLDDIRNWGLEALRFIAQERSMQFIHDLELQIADLEPIWAERAGVKRASNCFNEDFQEAVKDSTRNLEEYFNLLHRIRMQLPETTDEKATEKAHVPALKEKARKSLVKLLECVAELKVELRL